MNKQLAALICAWLLSLSSAEAKVGGTSLSNLVQRSQFIVVADVVSVDTSNTVATIRITETWKGSLTNTLAIDIRKTWTCDTSEAITGEKAVLFLGLDRGEKNIRIMHSGRGRLPIHQTDTGVVCDFWPEIKMPVSAHIVDGPDPRYSFIRSVPLDSLRDLVRRLLEK